VNSGLICVWGPLKGQRIVLSENETTIGRDPSNSLPISDPLLSRQHCLIRKVDEEFFIVDLNSRNGIFVNDIPVRERALQHGDQVELGNSLFVFSTEEQELPVDLGVVNEEEFVPQTTLSLKITPSKVSSDSQDLKLLLKISHAVQSEQNLKAMGEKLFEILFENMPVQRAAIFLYNESTDEFTHVCSRWSTKSTDPFQVSKTLMAQVIREKSAFLANDVLHNESVRKTQSLLSASPKSILCAPFVIFDWVLGVLYLDTLDAKSQFNQQHLQMTAAIVGIISPAIRNIKDFEAAVELARSLRTELQMDREIIGESEAIKKLYAFIRKAAPADSTVLITGESGTGKELVARAIHANSKRSQQPFVALNCAAIPEALIESELFGHEKGAFTGATAQKKGKLESAEGGTVFLDEIGELANPLQAKLLRALQEREIERLGGTRPIKINVRVIAATNRDLQTMIQEGKFRQDLFYRLNVLTVKTPALREMLDDLPLLARYFVSRFSKKMGRHIAGISSEALTNLKLYDWPGNIRELENAIERAVVMGSTEMILPEDLPEALGGTSSNRETMQSNFEDALKQFKEELVLKAFEGTNGNYNEAAAKLGVKPNYLYRLVNTLGLKERLEK
jgi:Nif-specific regulatory protein